MSEQITILQALPFLAALIILVPGILSSNFRLKFNKLTNPFFAGVLVLSFISLQILTFTYVLKFDIYYGLNAALLIAVLTAITFSPLLFKMINFVSGIKFAYIPKGNVIEEDIIIKEIIKTGSDKILTKDLKVTEVITEDVVIEEVIIEEEIQLPKAQEEAIIEQPVTKPEVKATPKKKPVRKHGSANTRSKRSGTNRKSGGKK
ncbi:MAG TPA: hypothetical protein PK605_01410 [Ignavibacteria bacterium]|nr:hypothetical protein [Bacteroidota bacterium]HRE11771.1 hypothetical protein [Ignavibacteria bacterium]HRF67340.1 hypothetical protein [Ignavibacteria bacterium]HRJ03038.1 hypothetical protein [Ignavibacteria bacterium]